MPVELTITNKSKSTPPSVPFAKIKDSILGKKYELSLVFVVGKESQKLNKKYRGKNKPTNVLSFELEKTAGEIFICLPVVKKETVKFGIDFKSLTTLLFIHGLLHLKGLNHGRIMDKAEEKFQRKFGI